MTDSNALAEIRVPGSTMPIHVAPARKLAALRPMVEHFGLDYSGQLKKLRSKSWATVENFSTVGADGKTREMAGIDRRTTSMWLATLDENRIAEEKRADLRAYQAEAADALDRYFHEGGAINPRATEHQVNALIFQSRARMELLQAAKGLIRDEHLEAKARVVLAAGLGDVPELESGNKALLYTSDFLKGKNLTDKQTKSIASVFGKRVKAAYIETHGVEPGMYPMNLPNGQTRDVRAYTEADRPLLEQVWREHYAEKVAA